ncbi:hypothetical protein HU200_033283 [Digitaria exilis]|uniref:Neprosin domain-containing protein n=1 Tax=Digitaria exilis TaxID=1010633 RepID=A0A835BLT2_9POAL|nr:hypothetical protein HU200_033283 [Digitaria exilis]
MQLKILNKPYVKSFKDEYGVIFDCVDMYKQPALDHPLLKNHTLQISPNSSLKSTMADPLTSGVGLREICPTGTVPIRRTLKQDLTGASMPLSRFQPDEESSGVPGQHADDYKTTGCLNVICPGFVVLSQTASPGMVLSNGFATAAISISKDSQTGNWQVFLNQQIVGYFPKELINGMSGATEVQMGGTTYAPPGQKRAPVWVLAWHRRLARAPLPPGLHRS